MKTTLLALAIIALGSAGCRFGTPPRHRLPGESGDLHEMTANTVFGNSNITELAIGCAGRIALAQGAATVSDGCFSGDTNVVLCTDSTAANPVMCAPHKGSLAIAGTDTINYARIR